MAAKFDELSRDIDLNLNQRGFDSTLHSIKNKEGNLVLDAIGETAVENVMHEVATSLDATEIIKLGTVTDLLLALILALPDVSRKYLANLLAKQVKKVLSDKSLVSDVTAAMLIEALDQGNAMVMTILDNAGLQPEDMRAALLDKFSVDIKELKVWLAGKLPAIIGGHSSGGTDPGHDTSHGPTAVAVAAPVLNRHRAQLNGRLDIMKGWDSPVQDLLTALQNGAAIEAHGDPSKLDGTPLPKDQRQWLGLAHGFVKGIEIMVEDDGARATLKASLEQLIAKGVTKEELSANPLDKAGHFIHGVVKIGHSDKMTAILDRADEAIDLTEARAHLRRFMGKDKPTVIIDVPEKDADGNVIVLSKEQQVERKKEAEEKRLANRTKFEVVTEEAEAWSRWGLKKIKQAVGIYVGSAVTICLVATVDTFQTHLLEGWLAIAHNVVLGLAVCGLFTSSIVLIIARLGLSVLDAPLKVIAKFIKTIPGQEDFTFEDAPIFKQANLITIVVFGLGVLFTVIAIFCAVGGGSVMLPILAILGVFSLGAWGELQKRFFHAKWSGHAPAAGHDAHPTAPAGGGHAHDPGEERKLQKAEVNFLTGLKVFYVLMAVFFGTLIITGVVTAGYRYHQTSLDKAAAAEVTVTTERTADCAEVTATLTKWAGVWNVKNNYPDEGSRFSHMCEETQSEKIGTACAKQASLCR